MGHRKTGQLVILSLVLLIAAAWLGSLTFEAFQKGQWMKMIITGWFSLASLIFGLLLWGIIRMHPSDSHCWRTLISQYLLVGIAAHFGQRKLDLLSTQGKEKTKLQTDYLMDVLKRNKDTIYGTDHKFCEIESPEDFIKKHPLTNYSHYEKYVKRIVDDGETNVMFKEEVIYIAITSGTTGKSKNFPINKTLFNLNAGVMHSNTLAVRSGVGLRRILGLRYKPKVTFSKTGLQIAPLSHCTAPQQGYFSSPKEAFDIFGEKEALYIHALFGLIDDDIGLIDGLLSTLCYSFFKIMEDNHKQLCNDIESGTINPQLDIPANIRNLLADKLKPFPERATFLRKEFAKGFKYIAPRVWPRLKAVSATTTGLYAVHAKLLKENHFGPEVQFVSLGHGATEGLVGLALTSDPKDEFYVILPFTAFYEFIEESNIHEENPKTVLLSEVEEGKSYEVVLTTGCGLYRYRLGDVIKITGSYANCPAYEYQYRIGQILNVHWERTPESVFYNAVEATVNSWPGVELQDYTAVENIIYDKLSGGVPGRIKYYVLFVELSKDGCDHILSDPDKKEFDKHLSSESELYNTMRQSGSIDRMYVIQIKSGGFIRLKFHMIRETQNQQFRMPRVLRNEDHLSFLLKEIINSED